MRLGAAHSCLHKEGGHHLKSNAVTAVLTSTRPPPVLRECFNTVAIWTLVSRNSKPQVAC